ncbi:MAG: hypothetical protein KF754_07850 [Planctomycetes bacterium]|nr:hypothetical protein [Planctomycetota bacterium]
MPASGGPAATEPAPKLALAATTGFTGPSGVEFTFNAGVGVALSAANLILDHQNTSATISVTAVNPAMTQNGITAPTITGSQAVGTAYSFSGTPASLGTTSFDVTLSDGLLSKTWRATFNVTNSVAPLITSTAVTTAQVGVVYTYNIVATGAPSPSLSVAGNPGWLTLTGNVLSGTPPAVGTAGPITITAFNGISPDATQIFSITIDPAPTAPLITSSAVTSAVVGGIYTYNITATGNPSPTIMVTGLPLWLSQVGNAITGTPAAGDIGTTALITVTATNGVSPDAVQTFTITVSTPTTIGGGGGGGGGGGCAAGAPAAILPLFALLAAVVRRRRRS